MSPRRNKAVSSAAVCALLLASGVLAQGGSSVNRSVDGQTPSSELNEQNENLRERNRSSMHPGDPLTIIGVEQDGNDIRSRTPALVRSDRHSAIVNDDQAYQSKLALYDQGGHAMQPVTIARPAVAEPRAKTKSRKATSDSPPTRTRQLLSLCIGFLASALFCLLAYKRYGNLIMRRDT